MLALLVNAFFPSCAALAQQPEWVLIPDESRSAIWRVDSIGGVSKIDFASRRSNSKSGFDARLNLNPSSNQLKLIYSRNNDLWLYDLESRNHRQLTRHGRPHTKKFASVYSEFSAWSPDGTSILYVTKSGEIEAQGDEKYWKVEPLLASFGVKILSLITGEITSHVLSSDWDLSGVIWFSDHKIMISSRGETGGHLDGQLNSYDFNSKEASKLLGQRGWYLGPKVSRNGNWAVIRVGTKAKFDSTEMMSARFDSSGLRSQIKLINLKTWEAIDVSPLENWAGIVTYAVSPSGASVAYFKRNRGAMPDDPGGELMVNKTAVFKSSHAPRIFWINESTLALVNENLPTDDSPKILILNWQTGNVVGEFALPLNAVNR